VQARRPLLVEGAYCNHALFLAGDKVLTSAGVAVADASAGCWVASTSRRRASSVPAAARTSSSADVRAATEAVAGQTGWQRGTAIGVTSVVAWAYIASVVAFDDDIRGTHPEDFQLLHYGHLHLFRNRWALSRLVTDLAGLGYEVAEVDAASCDGADGLRDAMIAAIDDWPSDYGRDSWPGFNDGLMDYLLTAECPLVVLVLRGLDQVRGKDEASVLALLGLLASIARWHLLFGRRLICLIETDDIELDTGALGGERPGWSRHEFLLVHRTGERLPPWITP
jgi:hypothetical protein